MSFGKLRASIRWVLGAAAMLILASSTGCGSHPVAPPIQAANVSLYKALAELEALETPLGVEPELFQQFRDELSRQLRAKGVSKVACTPPTGEDNRVDDLDLIDNMDGTFTLTWHYKNAGDYDQDGEVGISDITPLAQHFGESTVPENEWIDGDLDGRVHISDITPIAMNYAVEVAEYIIEGAVSAEGEFAEIDAVSIASATGKDTERAAFEYALTPGENGYFRVVPRDGEETPGEASNVVGLALEVLSVSPLEAKEGTVVTFSAEVTGAGPIEYAWDFGGQAVPATSVEASPEVVLTREVGEFSALLTVTNPQGDVTFPFTLTKLSREWRFETILSNVEIMSLWPQMKVHGDKLWIHACEDTFSPPPNANYVISGSPGNWEIEEVAFEGMLELNSEGEPGVAYRGGVLLDEVLSLAELRDGDWQITELEEARTFNRVNFTYANGNEPVITFTMPDERNHLIEYFWRRDGEWERGIVDEPGRADRPTYAITTDLEGSPVLGYMTDAEGVYEELTVAWWQPESEEWLIILVDVDWSGDTWKTGYYPDLAFRNDGKLAITYSSITQEIEPDIRYDRLIYAVYDGEIWEKEVVEELPSTAYDRAYEDMSLAHDPLGEPVIAVSDSRENDYDLRQLWRCKGSWELEILATEGMTGIHPSIAFDVDGNANISYYDGTRKEVIIGVYE